MKVLIPTNDGLTIAPDFEKASAFSFLTIINGSIKEDALRSASNDVRDNFPFNLKDKCDTAKPTENISSTPPDLKNKDPFYRQIAITPGISHEIEIKLHKNNYEVFITQETNIINAIIFFLKNIATMESDYCCNP